MRKIRKGDDVIIIAGKDKGKRGTVLRMVDSDLVVVEGANKVKKHERPNPNKGSTGGIVEMEKPIHVSNVAIYNPSTQKPDRVGFKVLDDNRKARCFKSTGQLLDV
jgi:large subunit ribosomal protein L24